jgi:hypothetical protein
MSGTKKRPVTPSNGPARPASTITTNTPKLTLPRAYALRGRALRHQDAARDGRKGGRLQRSLAAPALGFADA